jgi:hypothetical protein
MGKPGCFRMGRSGGAVLRREVCILVGEGGWDGSQLSLEIPRKIEYSCLYHSCLLEKTIYTHIQSGH